MKKIADRFKACIRDADILCRIGGDEFALLVPDITNLNDVDKIARRIIDSFKQPLTVSGHKFSSTVSAGIAIYPNNGRDGKSLLKKADIAMYKAKEGGKSNLQYFNNYLSREINLRNDIKKDLKNAIHNGELFLCYQPLIDAKTKKTVCLEALIRWKHPRKGIIGPVEFIPIAEETRHIISIGEWVLKNACKQLKEWHKTGRTDCGLSINVSAIQLQQPDFAEGVIRILLETGLLPKYLMLEITESVLIESVYNVKRNLNRLSKSGVKISIDDFGTGYNSLKYVQTLAANSLKIERTFVFNIKADINKVIIDAIISLGHKINAEIIAEGVETKEQYEYLKEKGCNIIQGYYFSKPLLPEEATEFLKVNSN
ncbi:putative bifunctional diguanylate cyclase/phosphodiesterase [Ruminiclostridium papyrosolvens]|uniref:putative bifunctional diguanylate cyclase/phosphodiesterase n=1 Tax=Ruminiclostridium papyrosolvens TaxID=29362 RepID=UPI0002E4BF56|nr:bifunctional diguanylate cyclase/phosphodiesterase [Ruminiclostridium papyrosolvens]